MAEEPKNKSIDDELDDWASAIDEWDANLSLPSATARPEPMVATAPPVVVVPTPREALPTPVYGVPQLDADDAAAFEEETRPLGEETPPLGEAPPPLGEMPLPSAPEEDPLMHLFDGDMELPEEAGQALGTLLGAEAEALARAAAARAGQETTIETEPRDAGLYAESDFGGSTRVASADEFDQLLADTAEVAGAASSISVAAETPPPPAPVGDFGGQESTRVALAGEVDHLLADDAEVEKDLPAPPPSGRFPSPLLPEPGSKRALARFAPPKKPAPRFVAPAPPRPLAPDDLEVEMELGPAIELAVSAPPPSAPADEEFYDDIIVERGREEPPPPPRPPLVVAPATAIDEDADDLFEMTIEPARSSDPDRTPLPVADPQPVSEAPAAAAPSRPLEISESRPLLAVRIAAPLSDGDAPLPRMAVPDLAPPRPLDADYLRDQLALYDTERLLSAEARPARVAGLAFAAGRLAERLGDVGGAIERYDAALEAEPRHAHALRGLRRLRLADGKREPVLGLLDREIAEASGQEARGLHAMRAELALALGDRDVARNSYEAMLEAQPADLGALSGLVDLSASGGDEELALALGKLYDALGGSADSAMRSALLVERARLDEAAGRGREAVARYREALGVDPTSAPAAWGLLRLALRTPGLADDIETHARLVELLPIGPLRQALDRRLGVLRARTGDVAGARPSLQAAADGDRIALYDLAQLEEADGRLDEAALALGRVIEGEPDAGRRADLLIALGELEEKQGHTAQAAAAYARAASDFPADPRAGRALERTQAAGGDKESALQRHLQAAERSSARAPVELTYAARLLAELGRIDEALLRLEMALTAQPTLGPAIDLAVELHLAAGRTDDAAAVLARAADAVDEPALTQSWRTRAARLLLRAGRAGDALAMVRPLGATATGSLRWLEERILRAAGGQTDALRDALAGEAEDAVRKGDQPRAAALAYELAQLAPSDEEAIEALRRVLALDPLNGAAAVEIAARLDDDRRPSELPSTLASRLEATRDRPEAVALGLRLGASLLEDARDPAAAAHRFAVAAEIAPGYAPAREGLDRVARASDDPAASLAALERERADAGSPELGFALDIAMGERLERDQHPDKAAERYRRALAARPHHPLARQALERALEAAHHYSALAELALNDLKEAPDPLAKVAAYERLTYIDGELRGDPESARLGWESIIEVDPAHHVAMRVLEKHYLREQHWPELVALYEQMGLTALEPSFAAAVHLDRARLRRRLAGASISDQDLAAAIDNDHRQALSKDRQCRPALRHVYARARTAHDLAQEAETASALAEATPDDARTAAVMLTRAAEALVELAGPPAAPAAAEAVPAGAVEAARARYDAAIERSPSHLPALIGLTDFALARGDWATASRAAERAGQALRDAAAKAQLLLVAGSLAQDRLDDRERAQALLRQALAAAPRSVEAFARLERLLRDGRDFAGLAEVYQQRLEVETDGGKLIALHLMQARIARDELKDRNRARAELKSVLSQDATHSEALAALADLQFEDQQWADAAETLIRRARAEKSRTALKDVFFKLGLIYSEHLPDPKRAVASFTRVLSVTPDDIVALEHLSNLHVKEWEWQGALQATLRLAELEGDPYKRIAHLHRVARIHEEGFKDARHALEALRRALEIDPMYLPSIGELAKFFDRQSDVQSMRVHLDRTAARVRVQLDANPQDPGAYHSLFKIFTWRRAPDRAAICAGTLEWLGAADADEKAQLQKLTSRDNYAGSSLADPTLDETLFDVRVPAGFRNLFRLLDEPLAKMFRADVKRLGVQRAEKLPRSGHALRDVANRIATDLGIRDFDLYVTAAHPTALVVELTDPLSIVIGSKVVEGAHELELRFLFGRCFKMIQSHMALPMRLTPEDLGLLVGGIVRQFVPDFVPAGFAEGQVVGEASRMARIIPKKMHGDLLPFALECASESLDLKQIGPSLVHTANRAGLLCCGVPSPSLTAVRRLADDAQLRALLRFTVSDELAELRRQVGTAIG